MARKRSEDPVPAPRGAVTVPDVMRLGACAGVWTDDPHDLSGASRAYGLARRAWEAAEHLDGPRSYELLPARRPWSLSDPDAAETLASRTGLAPDAIPALRRAAREHDTDPHRRSTL